MASEASTGTLVCRYCECVNQDSRQFCTNCGKRLHGQCVRCGTVFATGERFCGSCGADLAATARAEAEICESNLAEARRLAAEAAYNEAIKLLEPTSASDNPELADHACRAGELIREIAADRDRHLTEAQTATEEAQQHLKAGRYEAALALLEAVPFSLLDEETAAILEELRSRRDEVVRLSAELELANGTRKLSPDLLPKVERLLELDPDHAAARRVADRMRDGLYQAARQRLKNCNYDDAFKLVSRIPQAARTPETDRLHDLTAELASLWWDLRNAPVADRTLLAVAKRLRELVPQDPNVAKLEVELHRRAKSPPEAPRFAVPPWAPPPRRAHVGHPIRWITGFERIEIAKNVDSSLLAEHPGCFCVACGLALQAWGRRP